MEDKISIDKCRTLLGNNKSYSDEQIKQIRNYLYALGGLVVQKVRDIKDAFIKRFQSISSKGFIVK